MGRTRPGCLLAVALAAGLVACAADADPSPPHHGGEYLLTPSPAVQWCGSTAVTFTADRVFLVVVSNGTAIAAIWGVTGWEYDASYGMLDGDCFAQTWTREDTDPIPCPATGMPEVVTTVVSSWTGAFGNGFFDSELLQFIDDDCGVVDNCELTWQVHGERTTTE